MPTSDEPKTQVDEELEAVRSKRSEWTSTWRPELPLRKLLHRLQDPDFVDATAPPEVDADPVGIRVDLPTKTSGLRNPLLELHGLDAAAQIIERAKTDLVAECRRRGRSWAHIGDALGVTRQSAWMKYAAGEDD